MSESMLRTESKKKEPQFPEELLMALKPSRMDRDSIASLQETLQTISGYFGTLETLRGQNNPEPTKPRKFSGSNVAKDVPTDVRELLRVLNHWMDPSQAKDAQV